MTFVPVGRTLVCMSTGRSSTYDLHTTQLNNLRKIRWNVVTSLALGKRRRRNPDLSSRATERDTRPGPNHGVGRPFTTDAEGVQVTEERSEPT